MADWALMGAADVTAPLLEMPLVTGMAPEVAAASAPGVEGACEGAGEGVGVVAVWPQSSGCWERLLLQLSTGLPAVTSAVTESTRTSHSWLT